MSDKKDIEVKEDTGKERELARRQEHPFSLFEDIDKVFDQMTRRFFNFPFGTRDVEEYSDRPFFRTPLANVKETEEKYMVDMELPGLDKQDIELTLSEDTLEIKGETKKSVEEEEEGYVRREYSSANYYRAFKVPENVEKDEIDASLERGILKLTLPKKEIEEKEKKKINIK